MKSFKDFFYNSGIFGGVITKSALEAFINIKSLMDTGSSDCYIDKHFADTHCFDIKPISGEVTLAETSVRMPISGQCTATLVVKGNNYTNVVFNVLNN